MTRASASASARRSGSRMASAHSSTGGRPSGRPYAPDHVKTTVHEIPFARPEFGEAEVAAVADVLKSGWASQGPAVARFEEQFAARVGARCGGAVSAGTPGLAIGRPLAGVAPAGGR